MIVSNDVTASTVGTHYDDLDVFYREVWGEHLHHGLWTSGRESVEEAVRDLLDVVARAAGVQEGSRVCDVGCGYGGTSRALVESYGAEVVGFTVSPAQHRYATELAGTATNPRYELLPWEENRLADGSMDAVVSIECVSHVPDKAEYFAQIARVLRPGGRAAITIWLAEPQPSRWRLKHLIEPICREGRLASMASEDEYVRWAEAAGLVVESTEDWSRRVRKTWSICGRRLVSRLATQSKYRKALFDRTNGNRVFAITLFRILMAYRTGAMRYGFVVLSKPPANGSPH